MIHTANPKFSGADSSARTAEIMSRFIPIAPKPENPAEDMMEDGADAAELPPGLRRSPYLIAVWRELQSKPTRTRKRNGRTLVPPPVPDFKRSRFGATPAPPLSFMPSAVPNRFPPRAVFINAPPPLTVDLVHQLETTSAAAPANAPAPVISPTAVRPVGSTITVGMITPGRKWRSGRRSRTVLLRKADVERELELEAMPSVVSDSGHRVRLTNSAYNEMVGQPECQWLDVDMIGGGGRRVGGRRIGGEVALRLANRANVVAAETFTSWVRIEWGKKGEDGKSENVVNASAEGVRLACDSDDYFIQWRFHVDREVSSEQSAA